MYKRICTPIVMYKEDNNRNRIEIYHISILTSENHRITLYHSNPSNCMIVGNFEEGISFVNGLLKINGFRSKIVSRDWYKDWYNIVWVDSVNHCEKRFGKTRKEK